MHAFIHDVCLHAAYMFVHANALKHVCLNKPRHRRMEIPDEHISPSILCNIAIVAEHSI